MTKTAKKTPETQHTAARKRFIGGGGGVYTCGVCQRATRAVDLDAKGADLCAECYTLAGIENTISDNGEDSPEAQRYFAEAREMLGRLRAKGIDVSAIWASIIGAVETPVAPVEPPVEPPAPVAEKLAHFVWLVIGPHVWGKGFSFDQAFVACGKPKHFIAYVSSDPWIAVDDMGAICYSTAAATWDVPTQQWTLVTGITRPYHVVAARVRKGVRSEWTTPSGETLVHVGTEKLIQIDPLYAIHSTR